MENGKLKFLLEKNGKNGEKVTAIFFYFFFNFF